MLEWEWYSDINVCRLFTHLLLKANYKDKKWKGKVILRGQVWTSLDSLSAETGLSKQQTRTAISKLTATGEITDVSTREGRMITIVNYNKHQDVTHESTGESTDEQHTEQQTSNRRATDEQHQHKNDKKEKKVRSEEGKKKDKEALDFSPITDSPDLIAEIKRIRAKNKGGAFSQRVINGLATQFNEASKKGWSLDDCLTEWESRAWKSFKAEWIDPKVNSPVMNNNNHEEQFRQMGFISDCPPAGRVIEHE
jgi:hypothetical protein